MAGPASRWPRARGGRRRPATRSGCRSDPTLAASRRAARGPGARPRSPTAGVDQASRRGPRAGRDDGPARPERRPPCATLPAIPPLVLEADPSLTRTAPRDAAGGAVAALLILGLAFRL